jgi:hypothetical protein
MLKELNITDSFSIFLWINIFGKNDFEICLLPNVVIRNSSIQKSFVVKIIWFLFEIDFVKEW